MILFSYSIVEHIKTPTCKIIVWVLCTVLNGVEGPRMHPYNWAPQFLRLTLISFALKAQSIDTSCETIWEDGTYIFLHFLHYFAAVMFSFTFKGESNDTCISCKTRYVYHYTTNIIIIAVMPAEYMSKGMWPNFQ